MQSELENECNIDQNRFWKSIGKIGVHKSRDQDIPLEVINQDGSTSTSINEVLNKWRADFSGLLNCNVQYAEDGETQVPESGSARDSAFFEDNISILEVKRAVEGASRGKASGVDLIPSEVLKNDVSVLFLHVLFNVCFNKGTVPAIWGKCVIKPIPKSSSTDPRDPLSYRGIALASAVYKLYCSVINERLTKWAESRHIIADEQNGFRKKRSTTDHISSLTSIIDTRKKLKQSTFCAFIDFRKAYDTINRTKLWRRLSEVGVSGKLFRSIKSLYSSVTSCVRINNLHTDWFDVKCGLRQGCILSPVLFNLYVNDIAQYLKALGKGVKCDDDNVCILMYADDIVLLAETEQDLQILLNALYGWCSSNGMIVNGNKSKIVHFRNPSVRKTDFTFRCGNDVLETVDKYTYLGLLLSEHLDFDLTAKHVAQSASRALGLLISKCKLAGGLPFNVYTKLYDSVVSSIIKYGASIWGFKSYSCINAVQNRAMRFFLGVGKYTPVAALQGEMGWEPNSIKQWNCIGRFYVRISCTSNSRLNKRIALWASSKASSQCRNWFYIVRKRFSSLHLVNDLRLDRPVSLKVVRDLHDAAMGEFKDSWYINVHNAVGPSKKGRNKLRTYGMFKSVCETEVYCKMILPLRHRAALAKFRCGVAPLQIEIGRFENRPLEERKCPFCNEVESEMHVLLFCSLYDDFRIELFNRALAIKSDFNTLTAENMLIFLFSNQDMIRYIAKTCYSILQRRAFYLSK